MVPPLTTYLTNSIVTDHRSTMLNGHSSNLSGPQLDWVTVKHIVLRVLNSPMIAFQQLRRQINIEASNGTGGGGNQSLPLYAGDDSQEKFGKNKGLIRDLILFVWIFTIILFTLVSLPSLFMTSASSNTLTTSAATGTVDDRSVKSNTPSVNNGVSSSDATHQLASSDDPAGSNSTPPPPREVSYETLLFEDLILPLQPSRESSDGLLVGNKIFPIFRPETVRLEVTGLQWYQFADAKVPTLELWDVKTKQVLAEIKPSSGTIRSNAFNVARFRSPIILTPEQHSLGVIGTMRCRYSTVYPKTAFHAISPQLNPHPDYRLDERVHYHNCGSNEKHVRPFPQETFKGDIYLVAPIIRKVELDPSSSGSSTNKPKPAHDVISINTNRRAAVRAAFQHAWQGYDTYAWGHDEVRPVTNQTNDSWGSWGVTLVDGLDTAMIMGLDEEVAKAREHVEMINFNKDFVASFFETAIRYLGGLLGAFELSRDQIYLTKAREIGDLLVYGFDASTQGLPKSKINMKKHTSTNQQWTGSASILAEVGSIQLEMEYLSFHTGDPKYREKSRHVFDVLDDAPKHIPGLYPTYIDPESGEFTNSHISFGSFGDSFYEYLLKLYILTDRRDQQALRMYNEAMESMERYMIRSKTVEYFDEMSQDLIVKDFAFLGEFEASSQMLTSKMEHLTCFVPGLLALGTSLVATPELKREFGWTKMVDSGKNLVMNHQHEPTTRGMTPPPPPVKSRSVKKRVSATRSSELLPPPPTTLTTEELVLRSMAVNHTRVSTSLLNTCVAAYMETSTGLAPESIDFNFRHLEPKSKKATGKKKSWFGFSGGEDEEEEQPSSDVQSDDGIVHLGHAPLLGPLFRVSQTKYVLRPETIESLFIHWRLTHDQRYREMGWKIFVNLRKNCKTFSAFTGIKDANIGYGKGETDATERPFNPSAVQAKRKECSPEVQSNWNNSQESFFFAETLKYLYLLFSDDDVIPLDRYVFNTEAHPLGILVEHEPTLTKPIDAIKSRTKSRGRAN